MAEGDAADSTPQTESNTQETRKRVSRLTRMPNESRSPFQSFSIKTKLELEGMSFTVDCLDFSQSSYRIQGRCWYDQI